MACCCAAEDKAGTEVTAENPKDSAPGLPNDRAEPLPKVDEAEPQYKEFTITINKGDDPTAKIGLDITRSDDGQPCLKIKKVKPGHIMNWNETHPEQAVQQDDLIIKVNDECGSSENLLERIAKDDKLVITMNRVNKT